MARQEKILSCIDPATQLGIEIGALNKPIVTPEMGQIRYVDHASTEELKQKYAADPNVDVEQIVSVNYIWGEKRLQDLVAAEAPFDYVIASHVIEHVPDLIGWLKEIYAVLKPDGILSLAIPNKLYCFDYYRQPTQLPEVVTAHLQGQRRPGPYQVFDFYASLAAWKGQLVWYPTPEFSAEDVARLHTPLDAWNVTTGVFASADYHDVHCWVFTPESFFALINTLAEMKLFDFKAVSFYPTEGCEFFVSLQAMDHTKPEADYQQIQRQSFSQFGLLDSVTAPATTSTRQLARELQQERERNQRLQIKLEELRSTKQRLQKKVQNLKADLENRDGEIVGMRSSKFWKLRQKWVGLKELLPGLSAKSSPNSADTSLSDPAIKPAAAPIQIATAAIESAIAPQPDQTTEKSFSAPSTPKLHFSKLHLGCGNHLLSGWVNVDMQVEQSSSHAVLQHDLTQPLPFSSESVEFVFSEHFIEHITREQAYQLLRECHRVLKPNGVIRISTPALEKLVNEYLAQRTTAWEDVGWVAATPCQMVNEGMRLWGHQFLYDAAELSMLLQEAGFRQVTLARWRTSQYPELRDLEVRPFHQEVILEAVK